MTAKPNGLSEGKGNMPLKVRFAAMLIGWSAAISFPALAAEPVPWQLGFQAAVSPSMREIIKFHNFLLVITGVVVVFVLALLLFVVWRFAEKRNPTPSRTTHNTLLEVFWTTVPIIILVVIAIPSFKLLYFSDRIETADMTLKAIGRQWYWSYEYPDNGNFTFDANMIPTAALKGGQRRLMETDNRVVLPVGTTVRLLFTASDVLHSWAVPAFGIKLDAVPGRLNETWVRVEKEGVYYGFCSELCGINHTYMPIAVEVVSQERFEVWVKEAQTKFTRVETPDTSITLAHSAGVR
jgi:cytochrome c oxidase subunit 2